MPVHGAQAQAKRGNLAVDLLKKFATNFCSANSFHVNGDQKGGQYSNFTYNPFTLEGNFAFAQGIHELLLQSHDGLVEVFPAIPESWQEVSFESLRTEGAFLVSAVKKGGRAQSVTVLAEQGGNLKIKLPFSSWTMSDFQPKRIKSNSYFVELNLKKGEKVVFESK